MTIMVNIYSSKRALKESIGQPLQYVETTFFDPEYKFNGTFPVAHRPVISGYRGREFIAEVTMANGLIAKVK